MGQSKIDSLQLELERATVDSIKVSILHQLFEEHLDESPALARGIILKAIDLSWRAKIGRLRVLGLNKYADFLSIQASYDSSINEYQKSLELAEEIEYNYGIAEALIGLGNNYWRKGNYQKAREYQQLNIDLCEKIDDQDGIASSYNNLGNIYNDMGEYAKAMEYYTLSSKKYNELGQVNSVAITLANIGLIQMQLGNFTEAINCFTQSDSVFKSLDYQSGRAFVLKNLGNIYKHLDDFDQAISYHLKALESYKRMGRSQAISETLQSTGNIYFEQQNYSEAIKYYQEALSINEEINYALGIGEAKQTLGDCYYHLGNHAKAKTLLLKAIEVATDIGTHLIAMKAYETLSKLYAKENDFILAYESKSHYATLRDSLYTREKRDLAREIEAKYQKEQNQKEIGFLRSENELNALQIKKREDERNYLIALAFVILIIASLVYNQYRIKQKSNKKLKELDQLKSNFFANISHEFRTPLTLILGPLEKKLAQTLNPKEKEESTVMFRNANRLLDLINQLLDLSKLEAGNLQLQASKSNISNFLRAVASSFNSQAEQKGILYTVNIKDQSVEGYFDRDKLEKILYNLLSNAFKFTDQGEISIAAILNQEAVKLTVRDTGMGIPKEHVDRIFDIFYQADSSQTREMEGSGIGLALTKELVELHHGTIEVRSELGQGSEFQITLPINRGSFTSEEILDEDALLPTHPSPSTAVLTGQTADETTPSYQENSPILLIVEDNTDVRAYIKENIEGAFHVAEAQDGKEGLETALKLVPDLIISDLMIPNMDGIALCRELKTDERTSHIPLILLTARADVESKIVGLETGADDYLTKPL